MTGSDLTCTDLGGFFWGGGLGSYDIRVCTRVCMYLQSYTCVCTGPLAFPRLGKTQLKNAAMVVSNSKGMDSTPKSRLPTSKF